MNNFVFAFTINPDNKKWLSNAKENNTEIGYISGQGLEIEHAYVMEQYRGRGICDILLTAIFNNLDILYSGEGGLDDTVTYNISMQGADRMCYCLVKVATKLGKTVYRDGKIITLDDCGIKFTKGDYTVS